MIASLARLLAGLTVAATAAMSVFAVPAPASAAPTTGTVTGQITRPDGSPVAGQQVVVERWSPTFVYRTGTTNAAGTFSVTDVPAGDGYRVSIDRPAGRQYAPGVPGSNRAAQFTVAAGGSTVVDQQLLPVGTFALTVTEWTGDPANAAVFLSDPDRSYSTSGNTDAAGRVSVTVFAGSFQVSVMPRSAGGGVNFAREQWLHGKVPPARPDAITVAPDTVTSVTEQLLRPGSVKLMARDAETGAPITGFCASHTAGGACSGDSDEVAIADIRPGPFDVYVYAENGEYLGAGVHPVVVGGQTVSFPVDLHRAGRVAATVLAADTGAPVEGACLALVKAGTGVLPDGSGDCSDANGAGTLQSVAPGDYHLFIQAPRGSGYGAQWLGSSGGVGAAADAATITVTAGGTATVPVIRLDRAGTISGVVTGETGAPITHGRVSLHAYGRVGPSYDVDIDANGRYEIDWLGPYEWPLLFGAEGHARQWSGGTADRRAAQGIQVRSGQVTTYSPALRVGTELTGSLTDAAGQPIAADFDLYNAATGESMGGGWSPGGTYRSFVLGPQDVKLRWYAGEQEGWYDNASDLASATPIAVPAGGTKTLDLVLNV